VQSVIDATLVLSTNQRRVLECGAPPFFGANDADRRACAAAIIDGVGISTLTATIDGTTLGGQDLSAFRFASPPFNFLMPAQNNFLVMPFVTSGRSASDGY